MTLSELRDCLAMLHPSSDSAYVEITDGDVLDADILDVKYEGGVVSIVIERPLTTSIGDRNDFGDDV